MEGVRYIIQSAPSLKPPQGDGIEYTEAVHWYWLEKGKWTPDKKKAHMFDSPSDAVTEIRHVRAAVDFVELTLEPVYGAGFYRPL